MADIDYRSLSRTFGSDRTVPKKKLRNHIEIVIEDERLECYILGEWDFISSTKDKLKIRGYRWDGTRKAWWKPLLTDEKHRVPAILKESEYFQQTFAGLYDASNFDGFVKVVDFVLAPAVQPKAEMPAEDVKASAQSSGMSKKMSDALLAHQWEGIQRFEKQKGNLLLAWDMGCLDGTTVVTINRNGKSFRVTMKDLKNRWDNSPRTNYRDGKTRIRSFDFGSGQFRLFVIDDVMYSGKKNTIQVFLEDGKSIVCTPDHRFQTDRGWIAADSLTTEDLVWCVGNFKSTKKVRFAKKVDRGITDTYDISVPNSNCFVANGILVHNSGKTLGSMSIVEANRKRGIVICPVSLAKQWHDELIKWEAARDGEILVLTGSKKQIAESLFSGRQYKYYIMNYEKLTFFFQLVKFTEVLKLLGSTYSQDQLLQLLSSYVIYQKLIAESDKRLRAEHDTNLKKVWKGMRPEEEQIFSWVVGLRHQDYVLIYDETYKIKNQKAQITKAHRFFRKYNWAGVVALSGTPMENNLGEFYNLLSFVKPDFMRWWDFVAKFAWKDNFGGYHFKNLKEFNVLASAIMYRLSKRDIRADLPPLTQEWRFVATSDEAHAIKERLIAHAQEKAAELGRGNGIFEIYALIRTLDSGMFNPDKNVRENHEIQLDGYLENLAKFEDLENLLEEIGDNQLLIFTAYERTAVWLHEKLKKHHPDCEYVSSHVKDKDSIAEAFRANRLKIVIATDVWGRGVDFPDCPYLVNFDLPLNPATYAQRRDRIHRINSRDGKTVVTLVGNIIEDSIYEILKTKTKNFEITVEGIPEVEILNALKERWGFAPPPEADIETPGGKA